MAWPWEIVERDHDLQNPTSAEKIRLLGDYLRLTAQSNVLDLACGKAGPALILASTYGSRIHGIERNPPFADAARARIAEAGLADDPKHPDAADVRTQHERFRADYVCAKRALLGWAIFVGFKA